MQYMLMIYGNEAGMQAARKADGRADDAAYGAYTEAMSKAGVMRGGDGCGRPSTATTVRVADGKTRCSTGPMPRPRSSSAATT